MPDVDILDKELSALKIGKAAVALFQADIEGARAFFQEAARRGGIGEQVDIPLAIGALGQLTDAQWESGRRLRRSSLPARGRCHNLPVSGPP
jgi:hypothetical protein